MPSGQLEQVLADLQRNGATPLASWVDKAIEGVGAHPSDVVGRAIMNALLLSDLKETSSPCLPAEAVSNATVPLFVSGGLLQVVDMRDVGTGDFSILDTITERMAWKEPSGQAIPANVKIPRKCLMLTLSDGHTAINGMEMEMIPSLSLAMSLGFKVHLQNVPLTRGMALLTPANCRVLGGEIPSLRNDSLAHRMARRLGFKWGDQEPATGAQAPLPGVFHHNVPAPARPTMPVEVIHPRSTGQPSASVRPEVVETVVMDDPPAARFPQPTHVSISTPEMATGQDVSRPSRSRPGSSNTPSHAIMIIEDDDTPLVEVKPNLVSPAHIPLPTASESVNMDDEFLSFDLGEQVDEEIFELSGSTRTYSIRDLLNPTTCPRQGEDVLVKAKITALGNFRVGGHEFILKATLADPEDGMTMSVSIISSIIEEYMGKGPAELVAAMQRKDPACIRVINAMRQKFLAFEGTLTLTYLGLEASVEIPQFIAIKLSPAR